MPTRRQKRTRKKNHARLTAAQRANYCVRNWPRGEKHHRAVLTDHEVDLVLELRSEGWSYDSLALKFETPRSTIRDICKGLTRYWCG